MHFRQLATITGRATRTQFLTVSAVLLVIASIASRLDPWWSEANQNSEPMMAAAQLLIFWLVMLGLLITAWLSFATTVRRLHDTNHSGWWYLLASAPMLNLVMLVLLIFMPPVDINDYGPDPRDDRKAKAGAV